MRPRKELAARGEERVRMHQPAELGSLLRDLEAYPWLQSADLSPDGLRAAYVVRAGRPGEDEEEYQLWRVEFGRQAHERLAEGLQVSDPRWSPDGSKLVFAGRREGVQQLFVLEDRSREMRAVTGLPGGVAGSPAWSADGTRIAFVARGEDDERDLTRPYRVTRTVWRIDGIGDVEAALAEVWVLDLESGETTQVTADRGIASDPRWSPDGSSILYRCACPPSASKVYDATIRLWRAEGCSTVVPLEMRPVRAAWLSAGDRIVFLGTRPDRSEASGHLQQLFVLDLASGAEPEERGTGGQGAINGIVDSDMPSPPLAMTQPSELLVTPDGSEVLVRVQTGGQCSVSRFALSGPRAEHVVVSGDRVCVPSALSADGLRMLAFVSSFHEPVQLVLVELSSGREERLTEFGGPSLRPASPGSSVRQFGVIRDGDVVEAWFDAPPGEGPFPTVVYAHGGPHVALGHVFQLEVHQLLAAGFAVLRVNHHGSSGYGEAFARSLRGRWGELDGGDLLAALDEAIARGWADPDRLGICGISGGGYLTCWLVANTGRFSAAVAENPVTNFVSFYWTSDFGTEFVQDQLGSASGDLEQRFKHSPIANADRCTTPTLLIQSDGDQRTPPEQAEQFYQALKTAGCTVEMLRLPDSSHAGSRLGPPVIRHTQNEAQLEWLTRYVQSSGGESGH